MADDAIGLRGFAQVLNRPNTGNLYALAQLKQRQQAQEAELAEKRRKEALDYYDKAIAMGNDPNLDLTLNTDIGKVTANTRRAIQNEFLAAEKEGRTPNRMAISEMKANLENHRNIVSGYYNSYNNVLKSIDQNKDFINRDQAVKKLEEAKNDFMKFDDNGELQEFDPSASARLRDFFNDGSMWNVNNLAKDLKMNIGSRTSDIFDPSTNLTDKAKWTNILETKNVSLGGRTVQQPALDKEGNVIVKVTPETMALWNEDPRRREGLNYYSAQKGITKEQALREVMSAVVDYETDTAQKFTPGIGSGQDRPTIQPQLKTVYSPNAKTIAEAGKDGVTGYMGTELDFQNTIPQRDLRTFNNLKDFAGNIVYGEILSLTDDIQGGRKALLVQPLIPQNNQPLGDPIYIPATGAQGEANLQKLLNFSSKPSEKKALMDVINQQLNKKPQELVPDREALNAAVTGLKDLFVDKTDADEDAVRNAVKNQLSKWGLDLDVDVDVVKNRWFGDKETVTIDGKKFDVNDEEDMSKLEDYLHDLAPVNFRKPKGQSGTIAPSGIDW